MQKLLFAVIAIVTCFAAMSVGSVQAQEGTSVPDGTVTVAEIEVQDAVLLSQGDREISFEFLLNNMGTTTQRQIKYGVEIIPVENVTDQYNLSVADQHIFDEEVTLGGGQQKTITATHTIADIVPAGTYVARIVVANTSGFPFGFAALDSFTIDQKTAAALTWSADTCKIIADGEEYNTTEGIDFAATEDVVLQCAITNKSESAVSFVPMAEIYDRTFFGEKLGSEKLSAAVIDASATKDFQFVIPKVAKATPGAYQVEMRLMSSDGVALSENLTTRYVIQGLSASVQNIRTDQVGYDAGDTAIVEVMLADSADNFPNSRKGLAETTEELVYDLTMKNDLGLTCGSVTDRAYGNEVIDIVEVDITKGCSAPSIAVAVKDAAGTSLAQKDFETVGAASDGVAEAEKSAGNKIFYIVIIASLVLAAMIYAMRRHGTATGVLVLGIAVGGVFTMFTQTAEAATYCFKSYGGNTRSCATVTMSDSSISACEDTQVNASIVYNPCANRSGDITAKYGSKTIISKWCERRVCGDTDCYGGPAGDSVMSCNGTGHATVTPNGTGRKQACIDFTIGERRHYKGDALDTGSGQGWKGRLCADYTVEACSVSNPRLTAVSESCVTNGQNNSGKATLTASGTGEGVLEYRYHCGHGNWTSWKTASSHSCSYSTAKRYTARVQMRVKGKGSTIAEAQTTVNITVCKTDGACQSGVGGGSFEDIAGKKLCADGAASTLVYDGTTKKWTWTCNGIGGGVNAQCQAIKICPSGQEMNDAGQCVCPGGGSHVPDVSTGEMKCCDPSKVVDGKCGCPAGLSVDTSTTPYSCGCTDPRNPLKCRDAAGNDVCRSMQCTPNTITRASASVPTARVSCSLPEECKDEKKIAGCTIDGKVFECENDDCSKIGKELSIDKHPYSLKGSCKICDKHGENGDYDCDDVEIDKDIQCQCSVRKCTSAGTCGRAAMSVFAGSYDSAACSGCTSDADCQGGGLSEGQPN